MTITHRGVHQCEAREEETMIDVSIYQRCAFYTNNFRFQCKRGGNDVGIEVLKDLPRHSLRHRKRVFREFSNNFHREIPPRALAQLVCSAIKRRAQLISRY